MRAVPPSVRLGYVELAHGQMHLAQAGAGPPVLLLHQSPRSWDEYREVLPMLAAAGFHALAPDTPGFGASAPLDGEPSIQRWGATAAQLLDALGLGEVAVVGHHTGGVIALELAAAHPERVRALVLSSTPWIDAGARATPERTPGMDEFPTVEGGEHLTALWQCRQAFYPAERPDLLERFVHDALAAGDLRAAGHAIVGAYRMEERVARVRAPTLLIGATEDRFVYPHLRALAEQIAGARVVELQGGMVPLPDQMPQRFGEAVIEFLREHGGG
ncbi:MAG: alpha/beta fold hydrolase [Solirubrobacteraceae bacterium]